MEQDSAEAGTFAEAPLNARPFVRDHRTQTLTGIAVRRDA